MKGAIVLLCYCADRLRTSTLAHQHISTFLLLMAICVAPPAHAESRVSALSRVESYLSGITTIVADFNQVAPNGDLTSGKFYLKRPKQMRWQYSPPTPILMVTRGEYLTYYDYELDQVSDIPLQDTLLGFLSQQKISFKDKAIKVIGLEQEPGVIRLSLVQSDKPDDGTLTLQFSDKPLRLYNMQVMDATGQTTSINLNNARFDQKLTDEVFAFKDPRVGGNKRRKSMLRR
jgi:outer membrane lipoprotein-sorting protein